MDDATALGNELCGVMREQHRPLVRAPLTFPKVFRSALVPTSVAFKLRPMLLLEEVAYRLLPRVAPGRALSDWEWRVLVAVAEALQADAAFHVAPQRVADNIEAFLIEGRSQRAWRVRVLLVLIDASARAVCGKGMASLPLETRLALVRERFTGDGAVWRLCAKIRYLVLLGAYGDAEAVEATGFVPVDERARFRESVQLRSKGTPRGSKHLSDVRVTHA